MSLEDKIDGVPGDFAVKKIVDNLSNELEEWKFGSFWTELLHMEKNNFDIARQREFIKEFVDDAFAQAGFKDQIYDSVTEKKIILGLRSRLRDEAGMLPLELNEKSSWDYDSHRWSFYPSYDEINTKAKDVDIRRIADYIRDKDPEIVRYIQSVAAHNKPLGCNGGPNDHLIIRSSWVSTAIIAATVELLGQSCLIDVSSIWFDVRNVLIEENLSQLS